MTLNRCSLRSLSAITFGRNREQRVAAAASLLRRGEQFTVSHIKKIVKYSQFVYATIYEVVSALFSPSTALFVCLLTYKLIRTAGITHVRETSTRSERVCVVASLFQCLTFSLLLNVS